MEIGDQDGDADELFDQQNEQMIEMVEGTIGNKNTMIEKEELLAFVGRSYEIWAMPYPTPTQKKVPAPWNETLKLTADEIRDYKSNWSFLW